MQTAAGPKAKLSPSPFFFRNSRLAGRGGGRGQNPFSFSYSASTKTPPDQPTSVRHFILFFSTPASLDTERDARMEDQQQRQQRQAPAPPYRHDHTLMQHPLVVRNFKGAISIEGGIGAGKSTVIERLRDSYPQLHGVRIHYVPEPSEQWECSSPVPSRYARHLVSPSTEDQQQQQQEQQPPEFSMLQLFYGDQKRYAFPFQVFAFATRTGAVMRAIRDAMAVDEPFVVVTERSVLTDRDVFVSNLVRAGIFPAEVLMVYDQFWEMVAATLVPYVKAFIYLDVPVATCKERIERRGRESERGVPLDYLRSLQVAHEQMFAEHAGRVEVARIDWSVDIRSEAAMPTLSREFERLVAAMASVESKDE
jgi:deoxyadenosine/deoxycytidine kinase